MEGLDQDDNWKGWIRTTIGRDAIVVNCSDCRCRLSQSTLLIQGVVDGRDVDWIKTLLTEELDTSLLEGSSIGRVDPDIDWKDWIRMSIERVGRYVDFAGRVGSGR